MTNQRQHERIEIAIPVVIVHASGELSLESRNLSAGGMLLSGGTELAYGAAVRVKAFLPPNGLAIDLPATVRWVRDGAIGVQFGSMRAKETWAIHQLVKMLAEAKPA